MEKKGIPTRPNGRHRGVSQDYLLDDNFKVLTLILQSRNIFMSRTKSFFIPDFESPKCLQSIFKWTLDIG
jgi:hypothetical protein